MQDPIRDRTCFGTPEKSTGLLRNSGSGPEIGPDSDRESLKIGPWAGLRPAGGSILKPSLI